jgi:DNA ligase (NAD+)
MKDRGIGKGATVKVLRSGGVIPKIVGVVKKASFTEPSQSHQWKGVHLYTAEGASDATEDRIQVLQTVKFLRTLGIELLAAKSVQQLMDVLPNPLSYVRHWSRGALVSKLLDGSIGEKNAIKIAVEFNRVLGKPIRMTDLMVATHVFDVGVGRRRLEAIEAAGIPMSILLEDSPKGRIKLISSLHGFSDKTAKLVSDGMEEFKPLYAKLAKYLKIDGKLPQPKKIKVKSGKLSGQSISWTGYRSKDEEAAVEAAGGQVVPFGSKTTILLVKDGGKASSKVEKAESKGILVKKFNELGIS